MALFDCKVCEEKDARIALLMEQITMLRQMALPSYNTRPPTPQDYEMDRILSGSDEEIVIDETQAREAQAQEAYAILTGAYDQSNQIEIE